METKYYIIYLPHGRAFCTYETHIALKYKNTDGYLVIDTSSETSYISEQHSQEIKEIV